jgi:hypothetical protein
MKITVLIRDLFIFSIVLLIPSHQLYSQLFISSGSMLSLSGNSVLYTSSNVINQGTVNLNTGTMVLGGNLTDNGNFNAGSGGKLKFSGNNSQELMLASSASLDQVILEKTSDQVVLNSKIPKVESLTLNGGRLVIANFDLSASDIQGGNAGSYIETSGNGRVALFIDSDQIRRIPVGNGSFNPVSIKNNSGVPDSFYVKVLAEVYDSGAVGNIIDRERVKRTWDISRGQSDNPNQFDLVFGWQSSDKTTGLNNPSLRHFKGGYWHPQNGSYSSTDTSLNYLQYSGGLSQFSIQEYYDTKVNLKAYIQGLYDGNGLMQPALLNSDISGAEASQADSILISVHDPSDGSLAVQPVKTVLQTNGTATVTFPGLAGPYYLSVRHRNAIETWSYSAVEMDSSINYDFSTAASKAFGNNQAELGNGLFGFYSGDVNQDGAIESSDYSIMENDVISILFGYMSTDLTGDGSVESSDYALMENNIIRLIFVQRPF